MIEVLYDGLGRCRQIADPLGNVTTLARNAAGLATVSVPLAEILARN